MWFAIALAVLTVTLAGDQGNRTIVMCGINITCDENGRAVVSERERAAIAERERRAAAQRAEAQRRADEREAEFSRRRAALVAATQLSNQRSVEAERVARMRYEAMIARDRARGCWVPGDPPNPRRPACATQE